MVDMEKSVHKITILHKYLQVAIKILKHSNSSIFYSQRAL